MSGAGGVSTVVRAGAGVSLEVVVGAALMSRRTCGALWTEEDLDEVVHPPSPGVVDSAEAVVEEAVVVVGVGGVSCASWSVFAPGIFGSDGSVPIESSYVGRFGSSCFGCGAAGRVT
jgi:hypothetical protein